MTTTDNNAYEKVCEERDELVALCAEYKKALELGESDKETK